MGRVPTHEGDDFLARSYNERVRLLTKQLNQGLTEDEKDTLTRIMSSIEEFELIDLERKVERFESKVKEYDEWADSVCNVLDKTIEYLCENTDQL